jgi:luciferase family oxidoreductase group 1
VPVHGVRLGVNVPLSVLDLSPVTSGTPASAALRRSVDLAREVEALGYERYWLAEHHNLASTASPNPAVLIGAVAAATTTLRVGAGGVMLPNHSPLAVAETFRSLEALHPGRVDLGIGRAVGTDGRTALALQRSRQALALDDFEEQLAELHGYVDGFPPGHPFAGVRAQPDDVPLPPVWLLGSSEHGSALAARLGTGYAYAGHFGSAEPVQVLRSYREGFVPSPRWPRPHAVLTMAVVVAETPERARALAEATTLATVRLRLGSPGPLPSPEEAAAHRWTLAERNTAGRLGSRLVAGTPAEVVPRLRDLVERTGADELMVLTQVHDPAERRLSHALLAEGWGLRADRLDGSRSAR